jgi:hypothetical protein
MDKKVLKHWSLLPFRVDAVGNDGVSVDSAVKITNKLFLIFLDKLSLHYNYCYINIMAKPNVCE